MEYNQKFLNVGPGRNCNYFLKRREWDLLDCEPSRASEGLVINFNHFTGIFRPDDYYSGIFASHVLEHIHPFYTVKFLKEARRVMKPGATFRIIIPDARKSIEKYLSGERFQLFENRKKKYKHLDPPMTNWEAMKGCFISVSSQPALVHGKDYISFAHQNAWDFESIKCDLMRAGFSEEGVTRSFYGESEIEEFDFETELKTEAQFFERSMYVEVTK